jgi:NADPH-dependent 2,4-dienoyl-CoA reductase/sulfur reductase-like enzyme
MRVPLLYRGIFNDRNQLLCSPAGVVRDSKFFLNAKNIITKVDTEVTEIDRKNKTVTYVDLKSGEKGTAQYDN